MTAPTVTVVCDLFDGSGKAITRGTAWFAPSVTLTDAADGMYVPQAPVPAEFRSRVSPSVGLLPTDDASVLPSGWAWGVQFAYVSGSPAPYSFFLPAGPATFTAAAGTPAVLGWGTTTALTSLPNGSGVRLSGGSVPAVLGTSSTYYVVNSAGTTVSLATSRGGSAIASASAGSGSLTVVQYNLSALSPAGTAVTATAYVTSFNGRAGAVTPQYGDYPGRLLNDRGAIAASTAYSPGDMVAYQGQRVLITTAVTSSAWSNWYTPPALAAGTYIPITSQAIYYAADWGVVADGITDNAPALNRALQFMSQGTNSGGFLILPDGYSPQGNVTGVSSTVIIPPGCWIAGSGIETSCIRANTGMNADVIQFQTYNSSSQAAIITAATGAATSAGSLRNAFYAGLMNLTVHGNSANQGAGYYSYGVNMTTNPGNSAAGTDPDFDPSNMLLNVEIRSCTGDGFYHYGRGQLRTVGLICRYNQGWGASLSYDSLHTAANFGFNGLGGIYVPHSSCSGAAVKSYNNGTNAQWTTGQNWAAGTPVMYSGAMYRAINTLTDDTTVPSSDSTNWAHLSGATAPQYWGYGFVFDSEGENSWVACDGQENSAGDYYIHDCTGLAVQGVSATPNFNQATSTQNGSNPGDYAVVTLDGSSGCDVNVAFGQLGGVVYVLRMLNGSTRNDVRMTGDTTYAAVMSPDSLTVLGSGNSVKVNGVSLTDTLAALNDVTVTSPVSGEVLGYGASRWVNQAIAGGGGGVTAAGLGLALLSLDPALAANASSMASERLIMCLVTAQVTKSVTHLGALISGAGVTPGPGANVLGLFSEAGTLLTSTGDMTAAFESTGWAEGACTAYTVTAGVNYYLAALASFTGTAPYIGAVQPEAALPVLNSHYLNIYYDGRASLPASVTPSGGSLWFFTLCLYGR